MGAGRSELAKTIYGYLPLEKGRIIKKGKELNLKSSSDGVKNRIAYVSEDRKGDGLILGLSIRENMTLSSLERISKSFVVDKSKEKERVNSYIDRIRIKTPSMEQLIKNLSGGNQQKVAIAKALMTHPDVLILDEPTRGVDVGAKKEIYDLINEFKSGGKAIIMISSEMPEILGLCDRILVLSHGEITGEFDIKEATQEKILKCAVKIKEDHRDVISSEATA
ncbi:ATP-binding cassette domain-containing protein [Terrisporobacter vanillatitrophus]|uniref:ATP-binding cassette domain-containing protein n=1 Tax=Terrisporobacter vanillatitrophus TaxID=3058402 RepID=UPI003EC0001A